MFEASTIRFELRLGGDPEVTPLTSRGRCRDSQVFDALLDVRTLGDSSSRKGCSNGSQSSPHYARWGTARVAAGSLVVVEGAAGLGKCTLLNQRMALTR